MPNEYMWYEDDGLWDRLTTRLFSDRIVGTATVEVDRVLALLDVTPPARVLDLCCGVGRHAVELARRGFQVTGVDRTGAFLEMARKRAADGGVTVELVQEDMRRFRREGAFDAVINMFTSFGYFEDQADDRLALDNIRQSLAKDGRVLIEMVGKEILARIWQSRDWHEHEDGSLMLEERKVTKDWSWMQNRWILIDGEGRHEYRISHRVYSATEITAALLESGFSEVKIYGDLAGAPYDNKAKRLVAVAQK